MGLKKGTTNNINGRPRGRRNKVTNDNKLFWEKILKGQRKKIKTELDSLHGADYMRAVLGANAFVMPKMSSTDMLASVDGLSPEQTRDMLNQIIERNGKS